MTRRLVGGLAAAMFAVGILTGSAGMMVIRDATKTDSAAVMAHHMDGATTASMMSGSLHDQHHLAASPDGAK